MTVTETVKDALGVGEKPCKSPVTRLPNIDLLEQPCQINDRSGIVADFDSDNSRDQGADVRGSTTSCIPRQLRTSPDTTEPMSI